MNYLFPIVAIAFMASCTTQEQLEATAYQRGFTIKENYQAVYARANKQMRKCNSAGSRFVEIDGQLYPDLGYGEVIFGAGGAGQFRPLNEIRIEKFGKNSKVLLKTLTTAKTGTLNWLEYWVRGGKTCPAIHYSETPPEI